MTTTADSETIFTFPFSPPFYFFIFFCSSFLLYVYVLSRRRHTQLYSASFAENIFRVKAVYGNIPRLTRVRDRLFGEYYFVSYMYIGRTRENYTQRKKNLK